MDSTLIYDWSKLRESDLLSKIRSDWNALLKSKKCKESEYHSFLAENAGLFFASPMGCYSVLSKTKLGDDFEVDFITLTEGYSEGIFYELIEIESPHTPPFNRNGDPSARLTHAIRQIRDWQHWMRENRSKLCKLLPNINYKLSGRFPQFRYKIIIGNRENSESHVERRNQYSDAEKISIRSFDSLTDPLEAGFFSSKAHLFSTQAESLNPLLMNRIANPFFRATVHHDWKKIVDNLENEKHFFTSNLEKIL